MQAPGLGPHVVNLLLDIQQRRAQGKALAREALVLALQVAERREELLLPPFLRALQELQELLAGGLVKVEKVSA